MECKKCNTPLSMKDVSAVRDFPFVEIGFICRNPDCKAFHFARIL